jgi:hypothetical protein
LPSLDLWCDSAANEPLSALPGWIGVRARRRRLDTLRQSAKRASAVILTALLAVAFLVI